MPRKKNKRKEIQAAKQITKPAPKRTALIAHHHPSGLGLGLALFASAVLRIKGTPNDHT
jgi:hypothetical protein